MNSNDQTVEVILALQNLSKRLETDFYEDSIAVLRAIALISDECLSAHKTLADFFYKKNDWHHAIYHFEKCCSIDHQDFASLFYLGNCFKNIGYSNEAVAAFNKSLAIKVYPEGYLNLASVYADQKKWELEFDTLMLLLSSFPDYTLGHYNLGMFWYGRKDLKKAIDSYRNALKINPEHGESKVALSLALLMNKQYLEGFRLNDSRWGVASNCPIREFNRPYWHGQAVSSGLSILVTLEQGFGDTLQMLRYLPFLSEKFTKITIEVQPQMQRLVASAYHDINVVVHGDKLPETDFYCPIMSLPRAFETTYQTIPAQFPYILIPSCEPLNISLASHSRKKIGVCWRGGMVDPKMAHRSISLKSIKALFGSTDFTWFSLVKELPNDEREELGSSSVIDLTPELTDFYDTYRLITDLDVVITVDTSVAHLAGAMGKPTIVILNESYDWRWHVDDEMSAWYPSTRLLRAYKLDNSDSLVSELLAKVKQMLD